MNRILVVILVVVGLIVAFIVLAGPFFIVEEGQQAVVIRLGEIRRVVTEAGLYFKMPVLDQVVKYPKKIQSWDSRENEVIQTRAPENQLIIVEVTSRWKIIDPVRFYKSLKTLEGAHLRFDGIINDTIKTVISKNFLLEAIRSTNDLFKTAMGEYDLEQSQENEVPVEDLTEEEKVLLQVEGNAPTFTTLNLSDVEKLKIEKGRLELSQEMLKIAQDQMMGQDQDSGKTVNRFGIELIDIIIREIRYSADLTQDVYKRMIQERKQLAEKSRSEGQGEKSRIEGETERYKNEILSLARAQAEKLKGEGDKEAARIYREAYLKDSNFFEFWRTLESYRKTLKNFDKTMSSDADYFDYLYQRK